MSIQEKKYFFINVIVEVVCYLESKLIKIELNLLENNSFFCGFENNFKKIKVFFCSSEKSKTSRLEAYNLELNDKLR